MASTHNSLDAAAIDRKTRLAQLKSLKRKQPDNNGEGDSTRNGANFVSSNIPSESDGSISIAKTYTSGRNYDPETRGPKLGFETAPNEDQETLEDRASKLEVETRTQAEKEEQDEKPLDLFKLQPKKPNWDLKRNLAEKMEILNVRTDNAIARLVRERVESAKKKGTGGNGEEFGIQGSELLEGVHLREREEVEELRRAQREDETME